MQIALQLQIQLLAEVSRSRESREKSVVGACIHPNCLVIAFKTVLERRAAFAALRKLHEL